MVTEATRYGLVRATNPQQALRARLAHWESCPSRAGQHACFSRESTSGRRRTSGMEQECGRRSSPAGDRRRSSALLELCPPEWDRVGQYGHVAEKARGQVLCGYMDGRIEDAEPLAWLLDGNPRPCAGNRWASASGRECGRRGLGCAKGAACSLRRTVLGGVDHPFHLGMALARVLGLGFDVWAELARLHGQRTRLVVTRRAAGPAPGCRSSARTAARTLNGATLTLPTAVGPQLTPAG